MKRKSKKIDVKKLKEEIGNLEKIKFSDIEAGNIFARLWKWYRHKSKIKKLKKELPRSFQEQFLSWVKTILGAIIVVMILNGLLIASFVVPTGSMERTVMTGDFLFVNKFIYGPSTPQVVPFINMLLPFYKFPACKDPEKGDVIVFIFPGNRDEVKSKEFQYYLKRCVATAGDTLQVINKKLYVNGIFQPLPKYGMYNKNAHDNPYDKFRTFPVGAGYTANNYGPIRIPKIGDTIRLTGDNWRQWEIFIKREGHDITYDGQQILIDHKPSDIYIVERNYCFGMGDNRDNSLDSRFFGFIPYENVVGTPMIVYLSLPDRDEVGRPLSLFERILNMRVNRIGKIIE